MRVGLEGRREDGGLQEAASTLGLEDTERGRVALIQKLGPSTESKSHRWAVWWELGPGGDTVGKGNTLSFLFQAFILISVPPVGYAY